MGFTIEDMLVVSQDRYKMQMIAGSGGWSNSISWLLMLEDFTINCFDGSTFTLSETRGKVTFINLWATYCTPCLQELPHFDAFYREHGDDIAMLAVHSSVVTDDPEVYLADKGYSIPFALDSEDDRIWHIVNGSTALPQTIVLNRDGVVIYNQKGSVTPRALEALYEQASACSAVLCGQTAHAMKIFLLSNTNIITPHQNRIS